MTLAIRVATIGHRFPDAAIETEVCAPLGIAVDWLGPLPKEAALEAARDASGVLLGTSFTLDAPALARLPRCRVVVRYGVGVDNVDLAAATRRGITVCNVPDYGVEEVANHTVALLLLFARRLDLWAGAVRGGQWGSTLPAIRLQRLSRATLGVIGAGRIGRAVIARARPIWGHVLVTDPFVRADDLTALGAEPAPLEPLLADSDFITIHVPSSDATRGLLGAAQLRQMKDGVVIVNCSRGDVIDERALIDAITSGKVAGAGLDVFADEPPRPDGLVALPQVWPTPHIAFLSRESTVDLRRRAAEEAGRVLTGARPRYAVAVPAAP